MKTEAEIIIVGTGFAGIGMAIELKRHGIHDFIIVERAHEMGGTWRDNTYPGAACDVASHLYSYSFEANPNWSRMFSGWKEIKDYTLRCAEKYGLDDHIMLDTTIRSGTWDDNKGKWELKTQDDETLKCRFWISGLGPLNIPNIPKIDGLKDLKIPHWHSSEWKHDIDLKGKKVALVGTGASSIQIVPSIADDVQQLYVLQRTPAWVLHKPDREMKPIEKWLFKKIPLVQKLYRWLIYWKNEFTVIPLVKRPSLNGTVKKLGYKNLKRGIKNSELRKRLTPDYDIGCKRILLSDDYYPAFEKTNVELITTGIERFSESGIQLKSDRKLDVDIVIFCTGFQASEYMHDLDVAGKNGIRLNDRWANGPEAYLGATVNGFPNNFFIIGPNTGLGHNSMIYMIECAAHHVRKLIEIAKRKNSTVEVKPDVLKTYNQEIQDSLKNTVWTSGCESWYLTSQGKNTTIWPDFTFRFWNRVKRIREKDFNWR